MNYQEKQEKDLISDLSAIHDNNHFLANRLLFYRLAKREKVIYKKMLDAIDLYGLKKVDEAIVLFGNKFYERLIECDENHLQDECDLCRI